MSIEFQLNYNKIGMRPKGSQAFLWYTATTPLVGLHIHNLGGKWKWKVNGVVTIESKKEFDSSDDARESLFWFLKKELEKTLADIR